MNFNSMEFVFLFFPVVVAAYYFLPHSVRNWWLLIVSLFFYAWGETSYFIILIFSIVFNFFAALRIDELEKGFWLRKVMLIVAVTANVGILFAFKYINFAVQNLHKIFPATQEMFELTDTALPLGISFFTFQALSYIIDVYRGMPAEKKICKYALYISFFPQLISGPIVRYPDVSHQMEHRTIEIDSFSQGLLRFMCGFNKKMLLANILGEVATAAFKANSLSVSMAWLGAICYSLQLFFDFCGYSDMALGLGRMFGFTFLENFNYPYISKSVTEFWRRWHISLGSWFRDYMYFPLGGSRVKSKARMIFNLAVIWMATGIWHGANWTFVAWGLIHGFMVTIEKLTDMPRKLESSRFLRPIWYCLTMLTVIIGWVLFNSPDFSFAWRYIKGMFGVGVNGFVDSLFIFNMREYLVIFVMSLLCSTPLFKTLKEHLSGRSNAVAVISDVLDYTVQFCLFAASISMLIMKSHNPFIYFNF